MGFKFSSLVELLEDLERNRFRKVSTASKSVNPDHAIIVGWFNRHDVKIKRSPDEGVAFLSCLFPERRPDRCFHMQETRLASVFGKIYQLGTARFAELRSWKERTPPDFPTCLASVLAQTEMPLPNDGNEVTLQEINDAFDNIAANVKSSGPRLTAKANLFDAIDILTPILLRLQSIEAKWFIRMLLKSYHPVQIPEKITMEQFHFLLPDLLAIQDCFGAAMEILNRAELVQLPRRVSKTDAAVLKRRLTGHLTPKIGIMIKRQAYFTARSIKRCCQMANQRVMSVEQKYDGEYCQIHIDMSKPRLERIQIFSKSGRDSTQDRIRLHRAIEESVLLNSRSKQCKIKEICILEGELLIWNRNMGNIQPFHKIRKHVQHGGRFLNHEEDSPVTLDEQLMVMYYDILLLDQNIYLERPQEERRRCLERLIVPTKGLAEVGIRHVIDFQSRNAPGQLREIFASCITQRFEGFVLKACKDPYYSYNNNVNGIKLKKDYIKQLGDVVDVAFIGARLDPKAKRNLGHGEVKWNSFYMACLENKYQVVRFDQNPAYHVIGEVSFMPEHEMKYLNVRGAALATSSSRFNEDMEVRIDQKQMKAPDVFFKSPFVVEILGSGYERAPNAAYWTLRHPRVHKIHSDRSVTDIVSFDEFQALANAAQTAPFDDISQEDYQWIKKLEDADLRSKYIVGKSQSTTTTTPGRSPDLVTTETPMLPRSVPKSPPFPVWSDASQSPEIANEAFNQESSSPVRSETRSSVKRRCDEEAKMLRESKRKNTRSKPPMKAVLPVLNSSPLARRTNFTPVQAALASGNSYLKRTPPWCRSTHSSFNGNSSPFEPPAVFRSTPCGRPRPESGAINKNSTEPVVREPLAEVTNSSQAQKPPTVPREPADTSKASRLQKSISVESAPRNSASATQQTPGGLLPTPPSSAEEARKTASKGSSTKQEEMSAAAAAPVQLRKSSCTSSSSWKPEAEAGHRRSTTGTACEIAQPQEALPSPSPPILLCHSLRHLDNDSSGRLLQALLSTEASFAASLDGFVANILLHNLCIALLDGAAAAETVVQSMLEMMAKLRSLDGKDARVNAGRVLFLDWRFLERWKGRNRLRQALRGSRRDALGSLIWGVEKGRITVRECFDWVEALDLGLARSSE